MTRRGRIVAFVVFGLLAIGLIGYAGYTVRERIAQLGETVSNLEYRLSSQQGAIDTANIRIRRLSYGVNGAFRFDLEDHIDRIVALDSEDERFEVVVEVLARHDGLFSVFPGGGELTQRLYSIAEGDSEAQRRDASLELMGLVDEFTDFAGAAESISEEPVIVGEDTAKAISALTAAFGGLVSALISVAMFFKGGGRRDLEEEMLSLEVEMKRLEVDQFRSSIEKSSKGQEI